MIEKEKIYFRNKIIKQIESILQNLLDEPDLLINRSEGESSICSLCDKLIKACRKNPNFRCSDSIKNNTELAELEDTLLRIKKGTFGICNSCSGKIEKIRLEKYPATLYCSKCTADKIRIKKKIVLAHV